MIEKAVEAGVRKALREAKESGAIVTKWLYTVRMRLPTWGALRLRSAA